MKKEEKEEVWITCGRGNFRESEGEIRSSNQFKKISDMEEFKRKQETIMIREKK